MIPKLLYVDQVTGDILQTQGPRKAAHLTPARSAPRLTMQRDLWTTGRQWKECIFTHPDEHSLEEETMATELRAQLRHSNGLRTWWTKEGLYFECKDLADGPMTRLRNNRRNSRDAFMRSALGGVPLDTIVLRNAQGQRQLWRDHRTLKQDTKNKTVGDLTEVN